MKKFSLNLVFFLLFFMSAFFIEINSYEKRSDDSYFKDSIIVMTENIDSRKVYDQNDFKDCNSVRTLFSINNSSKYNLISRKILELKYDNKEKYDVFDKIKELSKREDVVYAEPNYKYQLFNTIPNDMYLSNQYAINNTNLFQAWDYNVGNSNIKIGIIDTGIIQHMDLDNNIDSNLCWDCVDNLPETSLTEYGDHGELVAGIIGAQTNNQVGISGVNWNSKLVSLRVASFDGSISTSSLILALYKAESEMLPVVNISLGNYYYSQSLKDAIDNYSGLVVCAAGNDNINLDNTPVYPACYDCNNILTVGAIDSVDDKCTFSNYGSNSVDIYAPGYNILSTYVSSNCNNSYTFFDNTKFCEFGFEFRQEVLDIKSDYGYTWDQINSNFYNLFGHNPLYYKETIHYADGYHYASGTSFSAPYVAGVATLLLSENSSLTTSQLKNAILSNADNININISNTSYNVKKLNSLTSINSVHTTHSYGYSYTWLNLTSHKANCICGDYLTEPHVLSGPIPPGTKYGTCILCGGLASMGIYITYRNSKEHFSVMDNGVIVVDSDYLANYTLLKKGE